MAHATSKDPNVFLLPDLGEGLAEAELIKWRVEVGQHVNELEVLAEMETDKALVEVTSPRSGTIKALHGSPGEVLKVGTPLVEYGAGTGGGAPSGERAPASKPAAAKPDNGHGTATQPPSFDEIEDPPERTEDAGTVVGIMSNDAKALATPAVRRLARDLGVDIDTVRGTGIGGRVMEKDVRGAAGVGGPVTPGRGAEGGHAGGGSGLYSGGGRPASVAAPARSATPPARPAPAPARPSTPTARKAPSPVRQSAPSGDEITRIPFRGVRRTIANRLRESVNRAVHFNVMDEADVSALDSLRRKLAAASGEKVSFLPFVASAVCRVLSDQRFGAMNATVDEKPDDEEYEAAIVEHRAVHLGIATDTDSGLMVPVIQGCDGLGVLEIAREIAAIAEAARNRTIPRDQLMGSTFTISNVGSHAGRFATPIINYPEVGILAVGRARASPVVRGGGMFIGNLLPLSLACDHRVVDGATAALALAEIVKLLQDPEILLGPARGS